jgi:hypothetical protein
MSEIDFERAALAALCAAIDRIFDVPHRRKVESRVVDLPLPADGRVTPELGAAITQIAGEEEDAERWDGQG